MSGEKDKTTQNENGIQKDENLRESFNKEITSNDSDVPTDIPDFTPGDDDNSGGSGSSED